MKLLRLTLALSLVAIMQGCLKEGYDHCPPPPGFDNVSIGFCLPDKTGNCVFMENITAVNALLYAADGTYTQTISLSAADLAAFKGIRMSLAPGSYRMVCWANMNGSMQFYDPGNGNSHISYMNKTGGACGNSDPVYYAPSGPRTRALGTPHEYYEFTVNKNGHTSEIDFRAAHRTLEVYVMGLSRDGNNAPTVRVSGLPEGLYVNGMGHLVDAQNNKLTVYSDRKTVAETVSGSAYESAGFRSLWFQEMDDVVITVFDKDGNERYSIPLIDAVDDPDSEEVIIRIEIVFKNGNVTVGIPDWNANETGIGFRD